MAPQRHGDFGFRDVQHCASQLSTIGGQGALQAAVFTQSPTSLAVVVTTGTVCVFDSHSHGLSRGALIAVVQAQNQWLVAANYIQHVFGRHIMDAHFCLISLR